MSTFGFMTGLDGSSDCSSLTGIGDGVETALDASVASRAANMISMSKLNEEMSSINDIAQGAFGVVKRGKLDADNHWYAVKQTKKVISGEGDLQRRLQEVYALSACVHPNIVRYFDCWVEDKAVFLRTELLPDGSVAQFQSPVDETVLVAILHQIALALHHLHSHGIIHRDVKPDNVLAGRVAKDGSERGRYVFKLADFGLARPVHGSVSPLTGEEFIGINDDDGDRNYLSPEALSLCDTPQAGPAADVYALGASCVELMGGDPAAVRDGRYTFDGSRYSASVQTLVKQMTAGKANDRPSAFSVAMSTVHASVRSSSLVKERLDRIAQLRMRAREMEESLRAHSP